MNPATHDRPLTFPPELPISAYCEEIIQTLRHNQVVIVCLRGRFLGIECKAGKNKPTPLQEKNLHQIEDAGGMAYVINEDNVGTFETFVIKLITSIELERLDDLTPSVP